MSKSVSQQREEKIRQQAAETFAAHVVTVLHHCGLYRSWYCAKPGSGFDSFTITTIPGHLFVTGDIGDLIVSREEDMIAWCRRAVDSTAYFASKVPYSIRTRAFSADVCREWICDAIAETDNDLIDCDIDDAFEDLNSGACGEEHMYEVTAPLWEGGDLPDFSDYTHEFLVCREAIRWLIAQLDAESQQPQPSEPETR